MRRFYCRKRSCMPSFQEEQRLASSRQAKDRAEQQIQEKAKAATDISCGVDQVRCPNLWSFVLSLSITTRVQQGKAPFEG